MKRFLASLALGAAAGLVDVLPMVALRTSRAAMLSAFLHWLVLGPIIAYVSVTMAGWLKGLILGLASALPVIATLAEAEPHSVPPVLAMSALLGSCVGFVSGRVALLQRPPS